MKDHVSTYAEAADKLVCNAAAWIDLTAAFAFRNLIPGLDEEPLRSGHLMRIRVPDAWLPGLHTLDQHIVEAQATNVSAASYAGCSKHGIPASIARGITYKQSGVAFAAVGPGQVVINSTRDFPPVDPLHAPIQLLIDAFIPTTSFCSSQHADPLIKEILIAVLTRDEDSVRQRVTEELKRVRCGNPGVLSAG